jgi:hypothetical protein
LTLASLHCIAPSFEETRWGEIPSLQWPSSSPLQFNGSSGPGLMNPIAFATRASNERSSRQIRLANAT